jgi:cytosine/adenosine deaminase-related metal-dependent hydrolase/ubiquinone/menaquinone biosynthesis C-methylase UbiE
VTSCAQVDELKQSLFDRWATVYDTDHNPLLRLEERLIPRFLSEVKGARVLDVGCGTGRWLRWLEALFPAALTGTDSSPAMLVRAREKLSPATTLIQADSSALPVPDCSQQLVFSSFVLSYIEDLSRFAAECFRVLADGGSVLLSDMHPHTEATRGWTRSFAVNGEMIRIVPHARTLQEILSIFCDQGFVLKILEEPAFGLAERQVFVEAGKLAHFETMTAVPAIYILKFEKPTTYLTLQHAPWSTGAATWNHTALSLEGKRISNSAPNRIQNAEYIDLSGYVLLPGLINAHDHLEFALYPNLGRSTDAAPYRNATEWAREIHLTHASTIEQHRQIPLATRLWWGAIRNLLCGVTTVCHHNPLHPELLASEFPIRVVSHFGWAHSLAFDPQLSQRYSDTSVDQPFILHAAEGTDERSREELHQLDRLRLLTDRTVLVHGLALTASDIGLLNHRGAAVILCPTSNRFLFGRTMDKNCITSIARAAIGSDSPITAAGDLLEEVHSFSTQEMVGADLLYSFVTTSAAEILHLPDDAGCIQPAGSADLIAIRDCFTTPADTLCAISFAEIELVLVAGRIQLASQQLYERLSKSLRTGLHPLVVSGHVRWLRAPIASLIDIAEATLGRNALRLGGKEVHRVAAL